MESVVESMHYCDPKSGKLVYCTIEDVKALQTRRFMIPYDSVYHYDTVQVKNVVYISGGGNPASAKHEEQYFKSIMRLTIMPSMEMVTDKLANMLIPRANHAMAAIGNKYLYVVGGSNAEGSLASSEEYSIEGNKWKLIAPLSEKKIWVSLCPFNEKLLYAFGGFVEETKQATGIIEMLDVTDPTAKAWTTVPLAKGGELWQPRFFAGFAQISADCILLFGGMISDKPCKEGLLFKPAASTMEKSAPLMLEDAFHRAKVGAKGEKIVVVGSKDFDLHIFDKAAVKWNLMLKKFWNPDVSTIKCDTI